MGMIADEWEKFRKLAVPAAAGPQQVRDTQRAFYAGVLAMAARIGEKLVDDTMTGTQVGDWLMTVAEEHHDFAAAGLAEATARAVVEDRTGSV